MNDNEPRLGYISNSASINSYNFILPDQSLVTNINENEIGPLIFNDQMNKFQIGNKQFSIYDLDLAENATFEMIIKQKNENNQIGMTSARSAKSSISNYLTFNPINQVESINSFSLMNKKAFDFDSLNTTPIINSNNDIGNKVLNFDVYLFVLIIFILKLIFLLNLNLIYS